MQTPPIPPEAASASPWRHEPTRGLTVGRSVLTFRATCPGLHLGVSLCFPAAPSLGLFLHTRIFDVVKIGRTVPLCLMLSLHRVISSACLLAPNISYKGIFSRLHDDLHKMVIIRETTLRASGSSRGAQQGTLCFLGEGGGSRPSEGQRERAEQTGPGAVRGHKEDTGFFSEQDKEPLDF